MAGNKVSDHFILIGTAMSK